MKIEFECLNCALGTFIKHLNKFDMDEAVKEPHIRKYISSLAEIDYNLTPPELGRLLHYKIREILDNPDPYLEEKNYYNNILMENYAKLKEIVNSSPEPLNAALKMSLAGNLIDSGANNEFSIDDVYHAVNNAKIALNESKQLFEQIRTSERILYLGDNCGEIVFDKLFIETLFREFGELNISFAVRGAPIINDATLENTVEIGLDKLVPVISNGYDAPGTILDKCSPEFRDYYYNADLIISKGQGNYESLSTEPDNIYFLLMAKCKPVASQFGVNTGDLIAASKKGLK